jgi:hypothetical protein
MYGTTIVERYDASLRGIVAELLWLVSVREDPAYAVSRRRLIISTLGGYAHSNNRALHRDIYAMIQPFGNTSITHLSGNLVSNLLNTLNAKEPGTNVYSQRLFLRSLICDISALPPDEMAFVDQESISDLTCQNGGATAIKEGTRVVVHGHPAEQDMGDVHVHVSPTELLQAPMREDSDSFTGGYPLSEATPQDEPKPEDLIVASFRAGDFELLRETHEPEVLISALSLSIAVMRLLLTSEDSATSNTNAAKGNSVDDFSRNGALSHSEDGAAGIGEAVV